VELNAANVVRMLAEAFYRNLGLKLLALGLAALLFVLTRDEVTRRFEVPLRMEEDPERVLLTQLPPTCSVTVRGPWPRLSRLSAADFDAATIHLPDTREGTLELDSEAVAMPAGVVLSRIDCEPVDLRFDDVVTKKIRVVPTLVGQPATDYKLVRTLVDPAQWLVSGGSLEVHTVSQLTTAPMDISGARQSVVRPLMLAQPAADVKLAEADAGAAHVEVTAVIEPLPETREVQVPVAVGSDVDPTGVVPRAMSVEVSGPMPRFRELDELGAAFPVEAQVVPLDVDAPDGGRVLEIRFRWAELVPPEVRAELTINRKSERVNVPLPPPPPEPEELGSPL
jgi:YbbR domain-containing protein